MTMATRLKKLWIDRIDFVDVGANPHARITIWKRGTAPRSAETRPAVSRQIIDDVEDGMKKTSPVIRFGEMIKRGDPHLLPSIMASMTRAGATVPATSEIKKADRPLDEDDYEYCLELLKLGEMDLAAKRGLQLSPEEAEDHVMRRFPDLAVYGDPREGWIRKRETDDDRTPPPSGRGATVKELVEPLCDQGAQAIWKSGKAQSLAAAWDAFLMSDRGKALYALASAPGAERLTPGEMLKQYPTPRRGTSWYRPVDFEIRTRLSERNDIHHDKAKETEEYHTAAPTHGAGQWHPRGPSVQPTPRWKAVYARRTDSCRNLERLQQDEAGFFAGSRRR
jgi:hypothetical protein